MTTIAKVVLPGILLTLLLVGCGATTDSPLHSPLKVEIVPVQGGYQLMRGGEPYPIKGAGLEFGDMVALAAHGGNSIRNWRTRTQVETAQEVLDRALANGVTVALCLEMGTERGGFDYDDVQAVSAQLEKHRQDVLKYRDHPALLAWVIGNELNLGYSNAAAYDAVNSVSKMIHELDPNHPTTTTLAGLDESVVDTVQMRAPDLDFISFQVYADLFELPAFIAKIDFKEPFFVTEWGTIGYWETDKTAWGAPIEVTSSQKAKRYLRGYRDVIQPLQDQLLGSYAFLWGQKQERTPTWFGLFTEAGEETEAVDVLHYIWNGAWPENRSPQIKRVVLNGKTAHDSVTLEVGQNYEAVVEAFDHEGDPLTYRWEVKPESDAQQSGGDREELIQSLSEFVTVPAAAQTQIKALSEGAYRLFIYVYDGRGHAGHANIPFLVR